MLLLLLFGLMVFLCRLISQHLESVLYQKKTHSQVQVKSYYRRWRFNRKSGVGFSRGFSTRYRDHGTQPVGKISSSAARDTGFTALYKRGHLLGPTYLCSHSFSAHLNCPICLSQSINVTCLPLKLTLQGV